MPIMSVQLSIIIVNYNVKYFLEQALHSIQPALRNITYEVFVVDNCSSDGSVEMVAAKFPWVKLIANTVNYGFGFANNQAIKLANGNYVLLQNPDTIVAEDTYEKILDFMDAHPEAGGLGVKMIDGSGTFLPESKRGLPSPRVAFYKIFGLSFFFPKSRIFGKYHLGFLDTNQTNEVDVLSGAFMLMRKEVLEKTGAFDEKFFMYGEDIDLSYRITKAGYKNYYFPGTTIIHYKGESTKKGSLNYVFVFYNAMIIFARKHFTGQKAFIFSLIINAAIYMRAGIAIVYRFASLFLQPLADVLLLFLSMGMARDFYEPIKFGTDGSYPPELMQVNVPIYVGLWIVGLYLSNSYTKSANAFRILRGIIYGTLLISIYYAFAPEEYRFSRALILLGAGLGSILLLACRFIIHFIKYRNLKLGSGPKRNILLLGDAHCSDALMHLISKSPVHARYQGYAGINQTEEQHPQFLGSMKHLDELIKEYSVNELVFSSNILKWKDIISRMEFGLPGMVYKIMSPSCSFAMGSNSKDAAGEIFAQLDWYEYFDSAKLFSKRMADLVLSAGLFIFSPLFIWRIRNKIGFYKNLLKVIKHQRSWVGPSVNVHKESLTLPSGIIPPSMQTNLIKGKTPEEVNCNYAAEYNSLLDVRIVLSNVSALGE